MSDKSRIEWTEATWNPVTGCTKVEMLGLTVGDLAGSREYDGALYIPAVREGDVTYTRRDTGETLTTTVQRRVWESRPVDDLLGVPA